MLSTPTTCASIGWATVASTTPEFAPGKVVVTCTWGGTISGYCARGMTSSDTSPAIEMTKAMTMANRGRSTKIADSIGSASAECGRYRCSPYRRSRSQRFEALDDDKLVARQALGDDDICAASAACLDTPDRHLPVFDDKHVNALLIGEQGSLGHDDLLLGFAGLEIDFPQLSVDQST